MSDFPRYGTYPLPPYPAFSSVYFYVMWLYIPFLTNKLSSVSTIQLIYIPPFQLSSIYPYTLLTASLNKHPKIFLTPPSPTF